MDRPSTSKARGICRYYTTERGCFAKASCKFLHGEEKKLTPYDQSKSCKFYANGYCRRGDGCWFRHAAPESSSQQNDMSDDDNVCNICLDKPDMYGLLAGCGHIFCLACIRQWRNPTEKSGDMVGSGVIKKCPLCRAPSKFVTPSTILFPHNDPAKAVAIENYKASMARVPCRYFQQSKPTKRFCPFGRDCFYQHLNEDGTSHVFSKGVDYYMKLYKFRRRISRNGNYAGDSMNPLSVLGRIFRDPFEDINATFEALRMNLPAFLEQFSIEERDRDATSDEGDDHEDEDENEDDADGTNDEGYGDVTRTLEQIADSMFEGLAALRDSAQPSPSLGPQSNAPDDPFDAPPPLEPIDTRSSSPDFALPQETPPLSPLPSASQAPVLSATSRFSTVVGNRSQERVLIDLVSEDEEDNTDDDATSEGTEQHLAIGDLDDDIAARIDAVDGVILRVEHAIRETETLLARIADEDTQAGGNVDISFGELTGNPTLNHVLPTEQDQPEPEAEPPFVTDGRGRVVWSSTRSGRGTPANAQAEVSRESPGQAQVVRTPMANTSERRMKPRRTARETSADTTESTGFTTDGRGRVICMANPVQTQASEGEVESEAGVEADGAVAESSDDGSRRSFLGRVFGVMFS